MALMFPFDQNLTNKEGQMKNYILLDISLQVGLMKEKYDHRLLLKHLPSDFKQFMEHLQVFRLILGPRKLFRKLR